MSSLAEVSRDFGIKVLKGEPRSTDGSNHANDEEYQKLRSEGKQARDQAVDLGKQASQAYERGDKAEAKEISNKSKELHRKADEANNKAASWVFEANNTDSAADEIDLHGLFVKEAIIALDARLQVCKENNQPELQAIVGKGMHSETHIAKLRPEVMKHCKENGMECQVDDRNPGVVKINVSGYQGPSQPQTQGYSQAQGQTQTSTQDRAVSCLGILASLISMCFKN